MRKTRDIFVIKLEISSPCCMFGRCRVCIFAQNSRIIIHIASYVEKRYISLCTHITQHFINMYVCNASKKDIIPFKYAIYPHILIQLISVFSQRLLYEGNEFYFLFIALRTIYFIYTHSAFLLYLLSSSSFFFFFSSVTYYTFSWRN